jgi:fructokinase
MSKSNLLSVKQDGLPVAGIELGGTKCICTLAFGPDRVIAQETVLTEHPEVTLSALKAILDRWNNDTGFSALGVASFGPVCLNEAMPEYGHILATNKPGWSNVDVLGVLSASLNVPVGFDTDVNGAALAEIEWGAGRALTDFAYVTVGTGIGVGLVVNGQTTRGIGHSEIGHMLVSRLPNDGFPGVCQFHTDCVEGLASGSAIKQRLGAEHVSDIAENHPVWEQVVNALACMCHNLVCATGPQRIAFGGGVISRQPHLLHRIENRLHESLAGYMTLPPDVPYIVAPNLDVQAGPLGSVFLGLNAKRHSRNPNGFALQAVANGAA